MDNLDNLIKAAEERGAADRLLHAGERAIADLGAEVVAQGAQMDDSGAINAAINTARATKTVTDLFR